MNLYCKGFRTVLARKFRNKAKILLSPFLFNIVLDILENKIKERKKAFILERRNKAIFADDIILYKI